MFPVTYTKEIILGGCPPMIDPQGFVYHSITLGDDASFHDIETPVLAFALMLPHTNGEGNVQFCIVDKEWRFVGTEGNWTYLN